MPELPEVEVLKNQLQEKIRSTPGGLRLKRWHFLRKDLRFPFNQKALRKLEGQHLLQITRRAKYLVCNFSEGAFLSHLGMTGAWSIGSSLPKGDHQHVVLEWEDGQFWIYRDPRRFGYIEPYGLLSAQRHPLPDRLANLGPEPLDPLLTPDQLRAGARNKSRTIKAHIMDQNVIVGIGNIYASEALFLAGIPPQISAGRLTLMQWKRLLQSLRMVLEKAIAQGGSTIRDYRSLEGQSGSFQDAHQVYGREGLPCVICASPIKAKVIAGRSAFWCPHCQKRGT